MPEVPASVLSQYRACSLYNSPYPAHDRGCAVDLYPAGDRAPSPVAGRVVETLTVRAPPKPFAPDHDHLVVIDTGAGEGPSYRTPGGEAALARILHVEPDVSPGDRVAVGDDLGTLVRAGFFAPWVATHLHRGVRDPGANVRRASGSLPLSLGVEPRPVEWDGTGTVVETAETFAILDAPAHPGGGWAGLGSDDGAVLDGGLPHYEHGGVLGGASPGGSDPPSGATPAPALLGTPLGEPSGRDCRWSDVLVRANGEPIVGLSLTLAREGWFVKLVARDHEFAVGDDVRVTVERA